MRTRALAARDATPGATRVAAAGKSGLARDVLLVRTAVSGSGGRPLDRVTRAVVEPRFGHDFGHVRVHTDATANRTARDLGARAFTWGHHIVFASNQYVPHSPAGKRLLVHELSHVVQQQSVPPARMLGWLPVSQPGDLYERSADAAAEAVTKGRPAPSLATLAGPTVQGQFGEVRLKEHKDAVLARLRIDYAKARKQNMALSKIGALGWETKLPAVAGGAYKDLADLWSKGEFDAFADAVASRQFDLNLPEMSIDGIIGPGTWARMAGLGEAMASITTVLSPDAQRLCYKGSEERLKRGYQLASGRGFELPEDATASEFNAILASMPGRMKDIAVKYRGTGAAGALVYAGLGEFVPQADIFKGGLRPGAAMQVWGHKNAYDLLLAGEITEKGKRRRITEADANFYGTSFVFVRYDTDTNERILVRHFSGTEWHKQADFDVWVAANTIQKP
jgi:hypothetical protein